MGIDKGNQERDASADAPDGEMSPVHGLSWAQFHNYLRAALAGDEAVPALILTRVGAALESGERNLEKRDRNWWRDFIWKQVILDSLRNIDDGIGELEGMAAWYRDQAEKMREEMDRIAERMGERSEFIGESTDIINGWDKDGKLDRQRAIEALRKRGVEADGKMSDVQILELLRQQQRDALEEHVRDSKRYDHLDKLQQQYDDEAGDIEKRAEEYRDERDRIMDDYGPEATLTDEERAERQRRLDELEERVGNDVVYAAADMEANKQDQYKQDKAIDENTMEKRVTEKAGISSLFGESADPGQQAAVQVENDLPDDNPPVIATNQSNFA